MKITFRLCVGLVVLFLHVAIQAREVTAYVLSVPAGATITDGGQPKPKLLGKAPLRVTVEVDNIDYKAGVLQEGRYSAKWASGAISRVLKYATPLGESEFVYVIERPAGADGEIKDQTAGQAHAKKHDVAAMSQELEAKFKAFEEKVTMLREKQKEEARLAEERKQQEMRLAAEQRQRELAGCQQPILSRAEMYKKLQAETPTPTLPQRNRMNDVGAYLFTGPGGHMDTGNFAAIMNAKEKDAQDRLGRQMEVRSNEIQFKMELHERDIARCRR